MFSDTPTPAGIDLTKSIDLRPGTDPVRERAQVAQLAQEFEAMLMLQMIQGMRRSMLDDSSEGQGLGGETMRDSFDSELARKLSQAGGFGLGTLLSTQLADRGAGADPKAAAARALHAIGGAGLNLHEAATPISLEPHAAMPLPVGPATPGLSEKRQLSGIDGRQSDTDPDNFRLSMPLETATTSAYGWRSDPLNGRRTFHHGVDLRAAYGADVPAAAEGQVVFAGERGGYGNMVVVQHANGVETRYAHLSSIDVAEGATVAAGTSVGRVGSTGRSTAPHLHFEVLVNGERIDPERASARLGKGPLKIGSQADD